MLKLQVTYEDDRSELIEIPLTRQFCDLRDYFKDTEGNSARSVEVLSRED